MFGFVRMNSPTYHLPTLIITISAKSRPKTRRCPGKVLFRLASHPGALLLSAKCHQLNENDLLVQREALAGLAAEGHDKLGRGRVEAVASLRGRRVLKSARYLISQLGKEWRGSVGSRRAARSRADLEGVILANLAAELGGKRRRRATTSLLPDWSVAERQSLSATCSHSSTVVTRRCSKSCRGPQPLPPRCCLP